MTWWAWMIAGALLLGAELSFINAQFYLVFIGASAIVVGLVGSIFPAWPAAEYWALFATLAIVSSVTFRRTLYQRLSRDTPSVAASSDGYVVLPSSLAPGESCQVEYRGSHWEATNDSPLRLDAGATVRVLRVQGVGLMVGPDT